MTAIACPRPAAMGVIPLPPRIFTYIKHKKIHVSSSNPSRLVELTGEGILAQFWPPVKHGGHYMLTTSEQLYLLDQMLSGYREVSRTYFFSTELKLCSFPSLPSCVFTSIVPEWTSNVIHYSKGEYLRVTYVVNYEVCGSIALPIFEPLDMSCCSIGSIWCGF
ncbi:hypothetical protein V6N13_107032 [Hibiscus sabdariffa]